MKKELIQSTKLLSKLIKLDIPLIDQIKILEQLYHNLVILKKEMPADEYSKQFDKMEKSLNEIIEEITNPKLINELITKINELLKSDIVKKLK